jgi:hypothetical protein
LVLLSNTLNEGESVPPIPARVGEALERASTDADPLPALRATTVLYGEVAAWQSDLVRDSVGRGATWDDIGRALGTTRQAAWARFRFVTDDETDTSIPARQELKAVTQRIHDEVRALQTRLKDFDEKWRGRQTELSRQARELERARREERKQLQQELRSLHGDLRQELRRLREPASTAE